jgi:hypothetical protein
MVKTFFFILLFCATNVFSQQKEKAVLGTPSQEEFEMEFYPSDPAASGVVLYSRGNSSIKIVDYNIYVYKEVHRKIIIYSPAT